MEHLEIPSNAYRAIKVPFLGEMYDPGIADFNEYPTKKGWDLENDRKAMENYRHLGETYRDVGMQNAVEFLEDLLHDPSGMTGEEQDICDMAYQCSESCWQHPKLGIPASTPGPTF
jgi:hypothetical protein